MTLKDIEKKLIESQISSENHQLSTLPEIKDLIDYSNKMIEDNRAVLDLTAQLKTPHIGQAIAKIFERQFGSQLLNIDPNDNFLSVGESEKICSIADKHIHREMWFFLRKTLGFDNLSDFLNIDSNSTLFYQKKFTKQSINKFMLSMRERVESVLDVSGEIKNFGLLFTVKKIKEGLFRVHFDKKRVYETLKRDDLKKVLDRKYYKMKAITLALLHDPEKEYQSTYFKGLKGLCLETDGISYNEGSMMIGVDYSILINEEMLSKLDKIVGGVTVVE